MARRRSHIDPLEKVLRDLESEDPQVRAAAESLARFTDSVRSPSRLFDRLHALPCRIRNCEWHHPKGIQVTDNVIDRLAGQLAETSYQIEVMNPSDGVPFSELDATEQEYWRALARRSYSELYQEVNDHVETFKDEQGQYRWRRQSTNGRIVSVSGEGFDDESYAVESAHRYNRDVTDFRTI